MLKIGFARFLVFFFFTSRVCFNIYPDTEVALNILQKNTNKQAIFIRMIFHYILTTEDSACGSNIFLTRGKYEIARPF